jgi:4-carboxymuconolactone decarboxylase
VLAREQELKVHLHGAKNLGISREKLEEMMIHLAHYGGWPVGVAGMRKIAEVFDKDKK